jgi:hypothetical protein
VEGKLVTDYERIGTDTLAVMLDPTSSSEDLELAVAIAPWRELREAHRRLQLLRGANVVFVSTEDSAENDLKPRLVAAQAAIPHCFLIEQHVRLPDDVTALHELAEDVGEVGLLVIDPVANHIGSRNSNSDGEVRDAIAPLNKLADGPRACSPTLSPNGERGGGAPGERAASLVSAWHRIGLVAPPSAR